MAQECLACLGGDASGIADNPLQRAKIQRRRRDAGGTKGSVIVTPVYLFDSHAFVRLLLGLR